MSDFLGLLASVMSRSEYKQRLQICLLWASSLEFQDRAPPRQHILLDAAI
jgi:hypothetical protein